MKRFIQERLIIFPIPYFFALVGALTWILLWIHKLGEVGTVLGMRGTGDWTTNQRPTNFREEILLLFPNTSVSLTALMAMLKSEDTDDPKFTIFTKALPTQRVLVNGSHNSSVTTINLFGTTPAKVLKAGHSLINERTLEVLWVVADPASPYSSIIVVRGKGSTPASMNDQDGLVVMGTHYQEGASIPTSVSYDPVESNNFTQIFRTSVFLTKTAQATHLRTGPDMLERQRETLELHAIEREMAYIFGTGVEDTSGAQPERTTKGFVSLITTNVTDFAGQFDIDTWETFLENVFEDGTNEKVLLCGNTALTNINKVGRIHGEIRMMPAGETYGLMLRQYATPYGYLQMLQHPLLSKNPTFNSWGIVIDTQYLVDRILSGNGVSRDTNYYENRQAPGDDAIKDEWLSETGLELQFESVNGVFKGASGFTP